jgi:hypothetical protein
VVPSFVHSVSYKQACNQYKHTKSTG